MAYDFNQWCGKQRAKLNEVFDPTNGHTHDGTNSAAVTVGTVADGAITNDKVNASAAIAFSKLAALASGNILVGNGSNVAASVAMSGDVTISNAGVASIASGVINATNLDSTAFGGTAAYGVPFIIHAQLSNLSDAGANLIQNSTFKYKIIDAWSVNRSASGGTWSLYTGSVGALGNAITNTVTVAASDTDIDRAGQIDDAYSTVASGTGGDLCIVGDAAGVLDIEIFVSCIRID